MRVSNQTVLVSFTSFKWHEALLSDCLFVSHSFPLNGMKFTYLTVLVSLLYFLGVK